MKPNKICPRCGADTKRKNRLCNPCHAANMRNWRPKHPLVGDAKMRANARSYAKVYLARGKLIKEPCVDCAEINSEMHHENYSKPLEIIWICRPCHLKRHGKLAA